MMNNKINFFLLLFIISLSGCTSLPQEAPLLSEEIGLQITSTKSSHLALLNEYFKIKRARIDDFVTQTWIPQFAKNTFKKPKVNKQWNKIVSSNNKNQRLLFITGLGTLLQKKINAKRIELMAPINELEELLVAQLDEHYDNMLTANSTLTVYLKSSSSIKELQNKALKKLKLDGKLTSHFDKADKIVEHIVSGKDSYLKNKDKIDKVLNKLK